VTRAHVPRQVTTACGHSFCRACLKRSTAQCGNKCPQCRAKVSRASATIDVNRALQTAVALLFPEHAAAMARRRVAEAAEAAEAEAALDAEAVVTALEAAEAAEARRRQRQAAEARGDTRITRSSRSRRGPAAGVGRGDQALPAAASRIRGALALQGARQPGQQQRLQRPTVRAIIIAPLYMENPYRSCCYSSSPRSCRRGLWSS
jgi:hypothetical protein